MRLSSAFLVLALLAGCGPLAIPMVQRLTPAEQQQVESAWANLLAPPDRIDPQTLLDCLIVYQLHHRGVDELHARSVKQTPEGKVIMTIDFDRERPAGDRFTFKLVSQWGWTIREHRWSASDVFRTIDELAGRGAEEPDITALEARWERFVAATQPAIAQ